MADEAINAHVSALRKIYYDSVKSVADDVAEQVSSGQITDWDALTEYVDQSVDGQEWVIITHLGKINLLVSENSDAAEEEGMDVQSGDIGIMQQAYYSFHADVMDALRYAHKIEGPEDLEPEEEEEPEVEPAPEEPPTEEPPMESISKKEADQIVSKLLKD